MWIYVILSTIVFIIMSATVTLCCIGTLFSSLGSLGVPCRGLDLAAVDPDLSPDLGPFAACHVFNCSINKSQKAKKHYAVSKKGNKKNDKFLYKRLQYFYSFVLHQQNHVWSQKYSFSAELIIKHNL